ncbi:MAG: protein translocase subunit SecD [Peptococcaceae bacterium]|nr:protein translocase subunit SecD [Peptococcaceae bacterium]
MVKMNVLKLAAVVVAVGALAGFSFWFLFATEWGLALGLDLRGGVHVVMEAKPNEDGREITRADMEQVKIIIERRINSLGVAEPTITPDYGRNRIIVELAGVTDPDKAVKDLQTMAKLTFRNANGEILMDGSYLTNARADIDNNKIPVDHVINIEFNSEGAKLFSEVTSKYVGQVLAIYLDEEELTAPTVNGPISGGRAVITGQSSREEASRIASLLRSGALPVSMDIVLKQQVGAQLGADSIQKSMMACLVAIVLIVAFMIAYYRLPGLVASFALLVFSIIVLWVLRAFGAVLTLTGIAGFVLSLGMAVDLNIIVFERIKEEIAFGKSLRAAVDAGFSRAFLTVIDSNITTMFVALTLLFLGSSSIKGFAVTLAIGLCASLFTAITFTRTIMRWVVGVNPKMSTRLFGVRRAG